MMMRYANLMMQGALGANIAAGGSIAAATAQHAMMPFVADPSIMTVDRTEYVYGARPIESAGTKSPNFRMARLFSESSEIVLAMAPGSADGASSPGGSDAPPSSGSGSDGKYKPVTLLEVMNFTYAQGKIPDFDSLPREVVGALMQRFGDKLLARGRPYAGFGDDRAEDSTIDWESLREAAREVAYEYRGRFDFDWEYFAFADDDFALMEARWVADGIEAEGGGIFVVAGEAALVIAREAVWKLIKRFTRKEEGGVDFERTPVFNGYGFKYMAAPRQGEGGKWSVDALTGEMSGPSGDDIESEDEMLDLDRIRELLQDGPVIAFVPFLDELLMKSDVLEGLRDMARDPKLRERLVVVAATEDPFLDSLLMRPEVHEGLRDMARDPKLRERPVVVAATEDPYEWMHDEGVNEAKTFLLNNDLITGNVNGETGWTYGRNLKKNYDFLESDLRAFKSLPHGTRMEILDAFTLALQEEVSKRRMKNMNDSEDSVESIRNLLLSSMTFGLERKVLRGVLRELKAKHGELVDTWTEGSRYEPPNYSDHFEMSEMIFWRWMLSEEERGMYVVAGEHGEAVASDIEQMNLRDGSVLMRMELSDGTFVDVNHDDFEMAEIRRLAKEALVFISTYDHKLDRVPEGETRTLGESLLEIANDPELGKNLLLVVGSNDPDFRLEGAKTIDSETAELIE